MGFKTIGLDISDSQLEMAKKCGADAVFNSMTNKNYEEEVKKLADGKGCHAAAVFSAANAAYAGAPKGAKDWWIIDGYWHRAEATGFYYDL